MRLILLCKWIKVNKVYKYVNRLNEEIIIQLVQSKSHKTDHQCCDVKEVSGGFSFCSQ